jgi:hypothetical protein
MTDENLDRLRAHRNNMLRYRRLLATKLTDLERSWAMDRILVVIIISALLMILAVPGIILVSKHEMVHQARTALDQ